MSSAHPDWPRGRLARSKTGGPNIEDALRTFAADKILVARALAPRCYSAVPRLRLQLVIGGDRAEVSLHNLERLEDRPLL